MNQVSHETQRLSLVALAASLFVLLLTSMPGHAFAAASANTVQILPPGQNTCQPVSVLNVTPYVYDGSLESFDITVTDNSYVGILGTVGQSSIPLQYITRWAGDTGGLKIHVDTQTTAVHGGLSISLTLISSPAGAPTCVSTISFVVTGTGITSGTPAPIGNGQPISSGTTPVSNPAGGQNTQTNAGSTNSSGAKTGSSSSSDTSSSTLQGTGVGTAYTGGLVAAGSPITGLGKIANICKNGNAYRLWIILFLLYIIIAATVIFAEPWFLENSILGMTASILVPLILLLGFWYFSESCRAASWIPVVACVIAIVALFLAFREEDTIIMLPEKIS